MTNPQRDTQYSESLPLKPGVTYVMLSRWPQDGDDWIHPDDRAMAAGMIPSDRIFRRELQADGYYELAYGPRKIRVRPALMEDAPQPVFEIGQLVKMKLAFEGDQTEIGRIYAIRYSQYHNAPQYYLIRGAMKSRTPYLADALEPYIKDGTLRETNDYTQWKPPGSEGEQ